MKRKNLIFPALLLSFCCLFTSCNNANTVSDTSKESESVVTDTSDNIDSTPSDTSSEEQSSDIEKESSVASEDSSDLTIFEIDLINMEYYKSIKNHYNTDKTFWQQFPAFTVGDVTYDMGKDFDDLLICDEELYKTIYSLIVSQQSFYNKVEFVSGYMALKDAEEYGINRGEEYREKYELPGGYYEVNPEFFGFSDMEGMYNRICEIYTGITRDNLEEYVKMYKDIDGKLCVNRGPGEMGSLDFNFYQAQYLLFYENDSKDSLLCIAAHPQDSADGITKTAIGGLYIYRYKLVDGEWRCAIREVDNQGLTYFTGLLDYEFVYAENVSGWYTEE